jgi:hypothetical protein
MLTQSHFEDHQNQQQAHKGNDATNPLLVCS